MFWEKGLNSGQPAYDFAASNAKRIRVIAGPGAGKSFSMRRRVMRLLEEGVDPKKILVLTFTNIAAEALKKDIREIADEIKKEAEKSSDGSIVAAANELIERTKKIEATTLHKLCLKILRCADPLKYRRLINDFEARPMRSDLKLLTESKVPHNLVLRDYAMDLASGRRNLGTLQSKLGEWLETHGGMILEELIVKTVKELEADSSGKWKYAHVLVDEYQDLNPAEQELVSLLTAEDGSLTVIGDDDQSIYSFKGANPLGLKQFMKQNPKLDDFFFEDCYRCPQSVVRNATELIKHNTGRTAKKLLPLADNTLGSTMVYRWFTQEQEEKGLGQVIADELSNDSRLKPGNVIVLTPERKRVKQIRDALKEQNLDSVSCFRGVVFDDPAARESFSWLCLLSDERDMISWRYLLGKQSANSQYMSRSYCRILDFASTNGKGVYETLELCCGEKNPIPFTAAIIDRYKECKKELQKKRDLIKTGSLSEALGIPKDAGDGYFDILNQAIGKNQDRQGQPDWLTAIRDDVLQAIYHPEPATMSDKIRVMSLHAAKGLSAGLVVIVCAEDDRIPMPGKDLREQRRLFYVAVTRCKGAKITGGKTDETAKKYPGKVIVSCHITSSDGKEPLHPSPFIDEMGREAVTFNTDISKYLKENETP